MKRTVVVSGVLAILAAVGLLAAPQAPQSVVRFDKDSQYHHIRVVASTDGFVRLSFDRVRGTQSVVKLGDPGYLHLAYTRTAFVGLAFLSEEPADVLFVGLGGGSMPMFVRHHYGGVSIDIAEIDPMVVEVAGEYFGFKADGRMKVHVKDGRVYIRRSKKKYDVIFLDAYNDNSIPFHLTTEEFLKQVSEHLKPGGWVVSNVWSPRSNKFHHSMVKTYQSVFPQFYVFSAGETGNDIFVASPRKGAVKQEDVVARAREIALKRPFSYDLAAIAAEQFQDGSSIKVKAPVLTDDYAPVTIIRVD